MPNLPLTFHVSSHPARRGQMLLLALAVAAAAVVAAPPVRAAGGDGLRQEANEHRVKGGLNPVAGTALLDDIASRRARQMSEANKLEHDLDYVKYRLNSSGVCWSGYGEIIAWERGYPDYSFARTVELWWDSPLHHGVMMTPDYNAAGAAWDTARDGGHYSVMVFVTLCNPSASGSSVKLLWPEERFQPDRQLVLKRGEVTGYRFSATGQVLARKTVRLGETKWSKAGGRAGVNGKSWLKVTSGLLTGYWVDESPDAFVRGMTGRRNFDAERRLVMEAGNYLAFQFDWLGRVTDTRWYHFGNRRHPAASGRAIINGRPYYLFSSTALEGYWVRDSPHVYPR